MYSLTSEEVKQIVKACADVVLANADKDKASRSKIDWAYGQASAKLLAQIGQLTAVIGAISVREARDGQASEEPPF